MTNKAKDFIEQFDSMSSASVFVQDTSRASADDAEIIRKKITVQAVPGSPEATDKLNRDVDVLQKVLQGRKLGGSSAFQAIGGHMLDTDKATDEEDPSVDMGRSTSQRFMGDVSAFYAGESLEEGETADSMKKMVGRNLLGIVKQFTGPFYGVVEPLAKMGVKGVGLDPDAKRGYLKADDTQLSIAKSKKAMGFKFAMKAKGDDNLHFFKKESEIEPYCKKWRLKKEWAGSIDHLMSKSEED